MLTVRDMVAEDIPVMQAIEKLSFPTTWPSDSFEREMSENRAAHYLVAVEGREVVGFVGAWIILDEVHITTIAVHPERRGRRVGRLLLGALLRRAVDRGARWTVLEVRESNAAAIRMYGAFGFCEVGKRKRYYENDENALVLWVGQMQGAEFRARLAAAPGAAVVQDPSRQASTG